MPNPPAKQTIFMTYRTPEECAEEIVDFLNDIEPKQSKYYHRDAVRHFLGNHGISLKWSDEKHGFVQQPRSHE